MKKSYTILFSLILVSFFLLFGFSAGNQNDNLKSSATKNLQNVKTEYIQYGEPLTTPLSLLSESFEGTTFPPAGWIKINVAPGATGWVREIAGTTPVPGFNGGSITVPVGGGNAVAFCSYLTGGTTSNDQWLITPQLTNIAPTDSLTFWLRKFGNYLDHMDIKISTTTPTVPGMTITVALLNFAAADSGWIQYRYPIGTLVTPGANIYIGFRQWVTNATLDGASFSLDLVNVTAPVGVTHNQNTAPDKFELSQNYPNPFNPTTNIKFSVPVNSYVILNIFDVTGREVANLVNQKMSAGSYTVSFDAGSITSGVYFYKMQAGDFTSTKKMILVK